MRNEGLERNLDHKGNEVQKFLISALADLNVFVFFMLSGAMFHSLVAS